MKNQAVFEIKIYLDDKVVMNLIFLNTGEIRQKRRSMEWLMRRVFQYELKTWKRRWDEEIIYEEGFNE